MVESCQSEVTGRFSFERESVICSPSGQYLFGLDETGDLGIWKHATKIWSAGTEADRAILQADGNFVVRDEAGRGLWNAKTSGPGQTRSGQIRVEDNGTVHISNPLAEKYVVLAGPVGRLDECGHMISEGGMFKPGQFVCSPDTKFAFGLSIDGDLGIWHGSEQVWSAHTCCDFINVLATLQYDGNFVVRAGKTPLWTSRTPGSRGAKAWVTISNDGVVTILNRTDQKRLTINWAETWRFIVLRDRIPQPPTEYDCRPHLVGFGRVERNEYICSQNLLYRFGLDSKGDLKLFRHDQVVWSTEIEDGFQMDLQRSDGNLSVRDANGALLWTSGTASVENSGSFIFISDQGVVSVVNPGGHRTWAVAPMASSHPCVEQIHGAITLYEGEYICSPNNKHHFGVFDGNLALWNEGRHVWSTEVGSPPLDGHFALAELVGTRFVLRDGSSNLLWEAHIPHQDTAVLSLVLGDDGIVKLITFEGLVYWTLPSQTLAPSLSPTPDDGLEVEHPPSFHPTGSPIQTPSVTPSVVPSKFPSASPSTHPSVYPTVVSSGFPTAEPSNHPSWTPSGFPTVQPSDHPSLTPTTAMPSYGIPSIVPTHTTAEMPIPLAPPLVHVCVPPTTGRLILFPGEFICSPSETFKFGLSAVGELVLLHHLDPVWEAGGCSGQATSAILQRDGNLVVYSDTGALWSSRTAGIPTSAASILVGDDGVATIHTNKNGHIWSTGSTNGRRIDANGLQRKVMTGYQGWFFAKGDPGLGRWQHWSDPQTDPNKDTITIDMWPDLSELEDDEKYGTDFRFSNGSVANLYSNYNTKTVERHLRWMRDYGIDGPFAQRFIGTATRQRHVIDVVLSNIKSGAEKYGRVFAVMYDISNGDADTVVQAIIDDWMHLVDNLHLTQSSQYLRHRGLPLLAIWGLGVHDRIADPPHANAILDWFQYEAEEKYRVTLMGGVPTGWRDLSRDSKMHDDWMSVYRRFDVLSPWTVGRMINERTVDYFRETYIEPDMVECQESGIDYMPVVFPGFSAKNLMGRALNGIPRNGGTFLWQQMHNAIDAGNRMIYIAMFDELDEGTAIYKVVATQDGLPTEGDLLALDADVPSGYDAVPNDWYLRLAGRASHHLKTGEPIPSVIPADL